MTPVYALLIAFFGWLLGLLTPGIVDVIRQRKERRQLALGIENELKELRARLALNAWAVWNRYGALTTENLRWAVEAVESANDRGRMSAEGFEALQQLSRLTSEALEQVNARARAQREASGAAASIPRIDAPFLSMHLGRLPLFDAVAQRQLLFIKHQINLFNELVEQNAGFFQMTFSSSLSEQNQRSVHENLRAGEQRVATRSRVIADAIRDLKIS